MKAQVLELIQSASIWFHSIAVFIMPFLPLIFLFVAKVIDNMLTTAKTIAIQRNKSVLAALLLIASNLIYYTVTKAVVSSEGYASLIVVSVAEGLGCFLAVMINNKMSKDRLYIHVIMNDDLEAMKEFRDFLAKHHIKNVAAKSYTIDWEETMSITAYTETRDESKLIDQYLNDSDHKFARVKYKA